jgi:hypothetical protein
MAGLAMTKSYGELLKTFGLDKYVPVSEPMTRDDMLRAVAGVRRNTSAIVLQLRECARPRTPRIDYQNHCWNCKADVDGRTCVTCRRCGYLLCMRCGECLCNWLAMGGYAWHRHR